MNGTTSFLDCVWYRRPERAAGRALELSQQTAENMFVIKDHRSNMFGVGVGDSAPKWCLEENGFEFICSIKPTIH